MLIAFVGRMTRGKTTAMELVESTFDFCENVKFADPIYNAHDAVLESLNIGTFNGKNRKLLQAIGKWGRDIDSNLWVRKWSRKVKELNALGTIVLCDDVRRLNEAAAVRDLGGAIIKIEGPARGELVNPDDESEMEIDLITADYTIHNTGDFADFQMQVLETVGSVLNG
jgi:hypothetical protein